MEQYNSPKEESDQCPHRFMCGGCSYQEVPYADQLRNKTGEVKALLLASEIAPEIIGEIIPSPDRYEYRNKMEYTFGDEVKGGPLTLGMHQRKSFMSVTNAESCRIVPSEFNEVLKATLAFCNEHNQSFYNKKSHEGLLRNLILRKGFRTGELLVNLVTSSFSEFPEEEYKERILALECAACVVGILHTINDHVADAVLCDRMNVVYGRPYYMEEVLGLRFKVNAFSFFQTNVPAAEKLYKDAIGLIDSLQGKVVYDLYCGSGTITQALAGFASFAIGVEIDEEAVHAAEENAKLNHLENCRFIAGDVLKVLEDIPEKPDVIVLDPPRAGIHPKAMERICAYGVSQLIYISCNPKSLIQNLPTALAKGYKISHFSMYDNFPFTKHIEALCLLEKGV